MELNPGYKKTDVGMVPEDWSTPNLGQLIHSVEYGSSAKSRPDGDIPVLRMGNLQNGAIDWRDLVFTNDAAEIKKYLLSAGDVLFNRTNTIDLVGKTAIYKGERPAVFAGYLIRINENKSLLDSRFLNYVLNAYFSKKYSLKILSVAVGQANINGQKLKTYPLPLPPTLTEQQAIAEVLSEADSLIDSLEQLLIKKRHIKQGAMQGLLTGAMRLPGFERSSKYKKTELGLVPIDWDVIPLRQVAQCLIGLTYSPDDVRSSGTLVLRSSNVQNGVLSYDDNVFVEMELPSRVITKKGDILVCVRNGSRQLIGKCAVIDDFGAGMAFGAFMAVLRSAESAIVFQLFQSSFLKRQISDGMGATINQITNRDMAGYKVIWPSLEAERNAIATTLSEMDDEIIAIETKLQKARHLKQGMMQELLTGRIRLV
jgi:type I restriction enzyme, S subunit